MPHDVSNVFFADCAARSFFDQVANKWSVMILSVLSEKPTRFNEIRRRLEGVTHKALTQALRRLERNGLIARHVLATSPVAVEYSLTELGRTLQIPLGAVYDWAIHHLRDIEQAREAYDGRAST
ncbi:helix-turn-helix domain-containing protein [Castellaniella daejeonensis]|jgi:DNA-binding HxlR family transcriptional regulator|uniref:Helix-turn-helix domain-containing protein n=1 Tax=Castellaniella daejeonensis TaxID=659013 RepID=A0ABN0TB73_9BURK|nr:helix-turn-helix domain-containing protein [Castellaniella sp.]HET8703287.1 helix-turn-helix domain-containing protein [Castellaniella sp.]